MQQREQRYNLVADYIWQHCRGQRTNAMELTIDIRAHWGITLDWHECAFVLERMERQRWVTRDGCGPERQAAYRIPARGNEDEHGQ